MLLVQAGSNLFVEDEEKLTLCDHAERQQHTHLALRLEAMMVFSHHTDTHTPSSMLRRKELQNTDMVHHGGDPKSHSPPDSHVSSSVKATDELRPAQEGEGDAGRGQAGSPCPVGSLEVKRPSTLDLECCEGEECVDTGCVSDLAQNVVDTHTHSHCGDDNLTPTEMDSSLTPQLVEDQLPAEWEEQVHLV
ncbi:uncharacterized protein ACWYII_024756 [Salvelinus alpinus]